MKRTIIVGYCIAVILSILIVPWKTDIHMERITVSINTGYSLIFSKPGPASTIDYGKVLLEIVFITAIAVILYVMGDKLKKGHLIVIIFGVLLAILFIYGVKVREDEEERQRRLTEADKEYRSILDVQQEGAISRGKILGDEEEERQRKIAEAEALFAEAVSEEEEEDERFSFSDLTVKDNSTGLVWTRDGNLPGYGITLDEAHDYIKDLNMRNYTGFSDWRLPSRYELEDLVEYAKSNNGDIAVTLNDIGFNYVQDYNYWTSTTATISNNYSTNYFVDMKTGGGGPGSKTASLYIWPVRDSR